MWMWILLSVALLPYLALPIVIKKTQRFQLKSQLRQLFGGVRRSDVGDYFSTIDKSLLDEGFRTAFDAVSNDYTGFTLYLRFYVSDQEKISAVASALLQDGEDSETNTKTMLEFNSFFSNGRELLTNNSQLPGAPLEPKNRKSRTFHFISNPLMLLGLHRHFIGYIKAQPLLPESGAELEFFKNSLQKELAAQEAIGGLILDQQSGVYRPSWAGAFLMAWYSMWPLSFVRKILMKQKAKIWLRKVNLRSA